MKLIERIKLNYRTARYRNREDRGGISYIESKIRKADTVLDIGAHKGAYLNLFVKLAGDGGRVVSFEPQTKLFVYLKNIKTLFSWKNVEIEQIALSDKNGTERLFIPLNRNSKGSSPGASLVKKFANNQVVFTETVPTETLDYYCNRNNLRPDFLKIDTEGNELAVLKGGSEIIRQCKPAIYVEIEARHAGKEKAAQTFEFLEKMGYTGYFLHGLNRIPINQFSFEKHQNQNDPENYCNNFIFE